MKQIKTLAFVQKCNVDIKFQFAFLLYTVKVEWRVYENVCTCQTYPVLVEISAQVLAVPESMT